MLLRQAKPAWWPAPRPAPLVPAAARASAATAWQKAWQSSASTVLSLLLGCTCHVPAPLPARRAARLRQARHRELEGIRLEVDSRRRTVADLARRVDTMRARLGKGGDARQEAALEETIKRLQHKEGKLQGGSTATCPQWPGGAARPPACSCIRARLFAVVHIELQTIFFVGVHMLLLPGSSNNAERPLQLPPVLAVIPPSGRTSVSHPSKPNSCPPALCSGHPVLCGEGGAAAPRPVHPHQRCSLAEALRWVAKMTARLLWGGAACRELQLPSAAGPQSVLKCPP